MENLLHYVWKYRLFDTSALKTPDGEVIELIDPGFHNQDSGPDFFNSKLRIGDTLWAGNVEIHVRASDWNRHGHQQNEAYNSVIAHVVSDNDTPVYNQKGDKIMPLQIAYPHHLENKYISLLKCRQSISCQDFITDKFIFPFGWKHRLLLERMETKTQWLHDYGLKNKYDWDDLSYKAIARAFGFGINAEPFERLARVTPYVVIRKHQDSLFQLEALLLGQAGFLQETPVQTDRYERMYREYNYLKHKYELVGIDKQSWKLSLTHAGNFPIIRLVEFAALLYHRGRLFAEIIKEERDLSGWSQLFRLDTDPFWDTHYSFEENSPRIKKRLGQNSINGLIINAVIPLLFAYNRYVGDEKYAEWAFNLLYQMKAEDNSIIRSWKAMGVSIDSAYGSQAFIQLQKEYCNRKKCLFCQIGYKIMSDLS
ncbi:MAG: DUF2851 family protein [Bacteroidales bacterium]